MTYILVKHITTEKQKNLCTDLMELYICDYRLMHGLFHIPFVISTRPGYRPEGRYQSMADDKGNMKKAMY